ncbi:MAG: hypothetical protein K2N00_09360 [Lachnospiraceae bacterium]|nr:hypothetical protein [Lachnospiraceae bacterium]
MDIINFEKKYVREAMEIALANYYDERQYVKDLPQVCDIPSLYGFAENGLGVAAFFLLWVQMQPFLKTDQ